MYRISELVKKKKDEHVALYIHFLARIDKTILSDSLIRYKLKVLTVEQFRKLKNNDRVILLKTIAVEFSNYTRYKRLKYNT